MGDMADYALDEMLSQDELEQRYQTFDEAYRAGVAELLYDYDGSRFPQVFSRQSLSFRSQGVSKMAKQVKKLQQGFSSRKKLKIKPKKTLKKPPAKDTPPRRGDTGKGTPPEKGTPRKTPSKRLDAKGGEGGRDIAPRKALVRAQASGVKRGKGKPLPPATKGRKPLRPIRKGGDKGPREDREIQRYAEKLARAADRSGFNLNDFVASPSAMKKEKIDHTKIDHATIRYAKLFLDNWDSNIRERVAKLNRGEA